MFRPSAVRSAGTALVACLLLAGCGRSGPELVEVRGKVTFQGGKWPAPGTLYFTPSAPAQGMPARPAPADFDVDGNFVVTSFREGDGLIPGKYKVGVECWKVPPSMGGPPAVSYLDPKYQSPQTSGIEVTIVSGQGDVELELDVPEP